MYLCNGVNKNWGGRSRQLGKAKGEKSRLKDAGGGVA